MKTFKQFLLDEGLGRVLSGTAISGAAGAALGASNIGGPPIGAIPGAVLGVAGYVLTGQAKKDWEYQQKKKKKRPT